jgi:hypothetical protein
MKLSKGKFSHLVPESAMFEAVVSTEVIEHLDPPDLERYWDVHLGMLQPNMLLVTTPNREFNVIFDKVAKLGDTPGRSYQIDGLDYKVRHDDHRFEYNRAEFEET